MTPGPVSDAYDPEYGTAGNADHVQELLDEVLGVLNGVLPPVARNIVHVARGPQGPSTPVPLTQRQLRALRFSVLRVLADNNPELQSAG